MLNIKKIIVYLTLSLSTYFMANNSFAEGVDELPVKCKRLMKV